MLETTMMNAPVDQRPRLMRVDAVIDVAAEIKMVSLTPTEGRCVTPAEPGADIDLHLSNGMVRQYSLVLGLSSADRQYLVAVKRDKQGRGGSDYFHRSIVSGSTMLVGGPRNNFPLSDSCAHTVLIAGGIGITPIWSMMRSLEERRRSFELHYAVKSRAEALFLEHLHQRAHLHVHIDDETGGLLDIEAVCREADPEAHLYCCGPASMLAAFQRATSSRPSARVHTESFTAAGPAARIGGFEVELSRTGVVLRVESGKSILEVVREAGIEVVASCEQGVCGACETVVLEGVPDHRCEVLNPEQRAEGRSMMICCGGAKTSRLVLDL
jgi:ferredoxin-NADP reductase